VRTPSQTAQGRTTDKIGSLFGKSGRTVEKIAEVCKAATADRDRYGKLLEDMDRTGNVRVPHTRLKVMQQAEAIRAEPPPYRTPSHRGVLPYISMSIAQICDEASKVQAIPHEDGLLWLWTTNHHAREAFEVLDARGFEQKTILTWAKDKMGWGIGRAVRPTIA
jgi:hypothetical protein